MSKLACLAILFTFAQAPTAFAAQPPEGAKVVYPEVATRIQLSNTDINRFICPERIKDAIYSKEKGVVIRYSGKDAYVKFLIEVKPGGEKRYITAPAELFIVCGEATYNIIAEPKGDFPAQTVYLSSGKQEQIKKNLSLFAGIPYEEKLLNILRTVYTGALPESFNVTRINKPFKLFRDISLTLMRVIDVEGEGLKVKEYSAVLNNNMKHDKSALSAAASADDPVILREKDFLLKELTSNPSAIAIDKHNLRTGDIARIFIIERTEDAGN